jgi:hypothetical protein
MKNVRVAGALLQVRSLLLLFGVTRPGLLRAADVSNVFHFSFKDDEYKCCWLVAELPSCRLSAPAGPIDAEKVYTYMRCWRDYVAQISLLLVRTSIRKKTKRWKGIYDNIDWNWPLPFRVSVRTIDLRDEYAQSSRNNNGNEERERRRVYLICIGLCVTDAWMLFLVL